MNYSITGNWTALSVIAGIAVGLPVVLTNAGRAGDLLEVIISDTEPLTSDRGEPLAQLQRTYRISGQTQEVWIRYIRYDLNGTITPNGAKTCLLSAQTNDFIANEGGIPNDLFTSNVLSERELKVSSENPILAAALNDRAFSFSSGYTVDSGQSVSLNMDFAAKTVIKNVLTNNGLKATIYNAHATGTADGIFPPINLNMCSGDLTPSTSQVFYNSTVAGSLISTGYTDYEPYVITCENANPSITVTNTTGISTFIDIHVTFEEIGPRNPSFGLLPNTLIGPNTEMSTYG